MFGIFAVVHARVSMRTRTVCDEDRKREECGMRHVTHCHNPHEDPPCFFFPLRPGNEAKRKGLLDLRCTIPQSPFFFQSHVVFSYIIPVKYTMVTEKYSVFEDHINEICSRRLLQATIRSRNRFTSSYLPKTFRVHIICDTADR